jgi:putative FmdB family regulatory protein
MPIYSYLCKEKKCSHEYEVFYTSQSKVEIEEPVEKCPKCGSTKKEKQVSKSTSFILKGKGWYKDGY